LETKLIPNSFISTFVNIEAQNFANVALHLIIRAQLLSFHQLFAAVATKLISTNFALKGECPATLKIIGQLRISKRFDRVLLLWLFLAGIKLFSLIPCPFVNLALGKASLSG
jgi:hypothetical protein